jgi:hypothetical protein
MHVTAGALLVRGAEILLVEHRAYGIVLQPGGHLEPADVTLAVRRSANRQRRPALTRAQHSASRRLPCTSSTPGSRHDRIRTNQTTSTSTSGTYTSCSGCPFVRCNDGTL